MAEPIRKPMAGPNTDTANRMAVEDTEKYKRRWRTVICDKAYKNNEEKKFLIIY